MDSIEIENAKLGEGITLIICDDERFFLRPTIEKIEENFPLLNFQTYTCAAEALKVLKSKTDEELRKCIFVMDDRIPGDLTGIDILQDLVSEGFSEKAILCLRSNGDNEAPYGTRRISKSTDATIYDVRELLLEFYCSGRVINTSTESELERERERD